MSLWWPNDGNGASNKDLSLRKTSPTTTATTNDFVRMFACLCAAMGNGCESVCTMMCVNECVSVPNYAPEINYTCVFATNVECQLAPCVHELTQQPVMLLWPNTELFHFSIFSLSLSCTLHSAHCLFAIAIVGADTRCLVLFSLFIQTSLPHSISSRFWDSCLQRVHIHFVYISNNFRRDNFIRRSHHY